MNATVTKTSEFKLISSKSQEGNTNEITLSESDPDVVKAVLTFLYGIPYTDLELPHSAVFHTSVYAAGEFYQLPKLKDLARHRFRDVAYSSITKPYGAMLCFEAANEIYGGTPGLDRGLRDILVDVTKRHLHHLIDDNKRNLEVLEGIPEFAVDLVRSKVGRAKEAIGEVVDLGMKCYFEGCEIRFGVEKQDRSDVDMIQRCPKCGRKQPGPSMERAFRNSLDEP